MLDLVLAQQFWYNMIQLGHVFSDTYLRESEKSGSLFLLLEAYPNASIECSL